MPLTEPSTTLVDELAKAGATLAQLEQVRPAMHDTVVRTRQANDEFATQSDRLRARLDQALEAERTRLAGEMETARRAAEATRDAIDAAHAARRARIAKARANARAARIGQVDADEGRHAATFQRDLLEAGGIRDAAINQRKSAHEAFLTRLTRERIALEQLESDARSILPAQDTLRGARGQPDPTVNTRQESELAELLRTRLDSASGYLRSIRDLKLRQLFAVLPVWQWAILVLAAQLVLLFAVRGTDFPPLPLPRIAGIVLVSLGVVYGLFFLGQRLGAPAVDGLAVALAEARTLTDACARRAEASFAADTARIQATHADAVQLLNERWTQRQAEARSQREQWVSRLDQRARQLEATADRRRRQGLADVAQAHAGQVEALALQSAERKAQIAVAHADGLAKLTATRDAIWHAIEADWQTSVLPIYTALKAEVETAKAAAWQEAKRRKLERLRPLLAGAPVAETATCLDFLSDELREKFSIIDTNNVSAHGYDPNAQTIIASAPDGFVLDCGAGSRGDFLPNVVNFEIVNYPSTDVRGVAEALPFRDGVFDGVLCLNVLEHVKDPFQAAKEIVRVMKPGARLYCVVPFLQPLHAYPHHYYNMTAAGLRNLFADQLEIERQEVPASGLPVWTLTWFLGRWVDSLPPETRHQFALMRVGDLLGDSVRFLEADFVKRLPPAANFELASTTALVARKREPAV